MPPEALTLLNFWLCIKTEQASLTSKESEGRSGKVFVGSGRMQWELSSRALAEITSR